MSEAAPPATLPPRGRPRIRFSVLFPLFVVVVLVAVRLGNGAGWGALDRTDGPEQLPLGIAHAVLDNLAYVAWAQQARDGILPFTVLQTTEPHRAVFVLPVFVLIGWLARLLDAHPLWLMNLAAPPLAGLSLYLVYLSARRIGLSASAGNIAMILTAFGSGLSALLRLLWPRTSWSGGADDTYLDIFPSAVFAYFPYQTIGLAALALLLYVLLAAEAAWQREEGIGRWPLVVLVAALAAMAVRPYGPAALLVVQAGLCALTPIRLQPAPLLRRRLTVLAALALGVGPLALYYHWVSLQPVWSAYVRLDLGIDRLDWLIGFGLFWPAAAAGAIMGWRGRENVELVVLWVGLVALLLLILNSRDSKFAEGGLIALALLSALAAERAFGAARRMGQMARMLAWQGLGLLLLIAVLGTLSLHGRGPAADSFPVDRELVLAARQVRAAHPGAVPTVLTEARAGALLPALASLRVYVGHWSLTLDLAAKRERLRRAGLEPDSPALDAPARQAAFRALLRAARFDYVLVHKDRPAVPTIAADGRFSTAFEGRRWLLYRRAAP